jgi:TolB-like protein/DNA-binding winged helix-turn-helix (wHTH) protein/tetratricopeptide (TPR) repeat protein
MRPATQIPTIIRFDGYELDVTAEELRKNGFSLKLQPQPFKILAYLATHPGALVTRQELRDHVWPGDTFVDFDLAINQAIKQIRGVLNDDAESPRIIATLPRRGYRFIAKTEARATSEIGSGTQLPQVHNIAEPQLKAVGAAARKRRRIPVALALSAILLLLAPLIGYRMARTKLPTAQMRMVVLPFQNLTGDPGQEYFADGMTEEMIAELGAMDPDRLGVIARTSAVKYKNSGKGIDQIGQELRVDYVLEGSVREAASRVRITAQLIRVSDQMHVWSESFDRDFKDIVALQADVAQAIASRIDVGLNQHQTQPAQLGQTNWEAYSAYLKGRHLLLDNKTNATVAVALQYFQRATELDSNFALGYTGLADAYAEQADADLDPVQAFALSKQAALRALSINPNLAEAHVSLANELLYEEWKWAEAEREYKRALDLKPTYEEAHHSYSHYLTLAGRHQEALRESQRLLQLDPLSSHMNSHMGLAYDRAGRFDDAIAQFKKTIALDPNYVRVYQHMGYTYELHKMIPEAIAAYRKGVSLAGETLEVQSDLARALIEEGQREEGLRILRRLEAAASHRYVSPVDLAGIYAVLGDHERALHLLETALQQHNRSLLFIHLYAEFDGLRGDPRFLHILDEVHAMPRVSQ